MPRLWRTLERFASVAVIIALAVTIGLTAARGEDFPLVAEIRTVLDGGAPDLESRSQSTPNPSPVRNRSGGLVGMNFTHYAQRRRCSLDDTGIVTSYDVEGVRSRVRSQLDAMRRHGLETLRLIVWHQADVTGRRWGVISDQRGVLSARGVRNLQRYFADVRLTGFRRLTVSFAPMGTGDPRHITYDPRRLDVNWAVISQVREVLKAYGPRETRVDLLNEGAPATWADRSLTAQTVDYMAEIYRRYVSYYGHRDVVISATASQTRVDTKARLNNLLDAFAKSGASFPRWLEVHLGYNARRARAGLEAVDAVLSARQLFRQSLVIGEAAYNDRGVARAIARFKQRSSRKITEVMAWPLTRNRPCKDISVAPPYRADAYLDPS